MGKEKDGGRREECASLPRTCDARHVRGDVGHGVRAARVAAAQQLHQLRQRDPAADAQAPLARAPPLISWAPFASVAQAARVRLVQEDC